MHLALLPPLLVALAAIGALVPARRLRAGKKPWPSQAWAILLVCGAVAAVVVRAIERFVVDVAVGERLSAASGDRVSVALDSFGIVGPATVLSLATIVWPIVRRGLDDEVDPPLAAMAAAASFVVGRMLTFVFIEKNDPALLGSGVRAALSAFDEIAIAGTWGYGLARSAYDGKLGGTPFGRYALGMMLVRGAVSFAIRIRGPTPIAFAVAVGVVCSLSLAMAIWRMRGPDRAHPESLASVGQETIREIARAQLRRGGIRPLWVFLGALGNLGGIVVGFAAAVAVGHGAKIDFGEIDRSGPAAEYAALLLVLGVIVSFPMSAAIVGLAGGGRNASRPYVLEAGLSAILALTTLLFAVGVVAPVAVALGVACAPVAFVLAGLGAWISAGRRN